ncbi:MAG: glycoside hydrolase family 9 protein [Sphingomonadaceae bacterium]|nr:glycoside hydrolase family 9 protein [Sphingomonadaceae bacterium]
MDLWRRRLALCGAILAALSLPRAALADGPSARFDWFDYRGSDPVDATLHPGANDYRNPILRGFYPDPSVVRAGNIYYLVNSTFAFFPGIPVFRSSDLVHWAQIGNAIDRPDMLDFGRLGISRGVFAPSIAFHDGAFYILNTCVDCGGNFVITARDPTGPWSAPVWLPALEGGIDPSLFFDEDGRAWLVNNGPPEGASRYPGHRAIWLQEFDPRTLRSFGPRRVLVDGGVNPAANPIWIEGPRIFRTGGFYYLTCAEGGTEEGHSQVVLRSRSVTGPYLPYPGNPILTQRDLPRDRPFPISSAGHAQLVETQNGEWWATFLATRPYSQDFYNTGRETFLLPVRWQDGWPRITAAGERVAYVHARPNLPPDSAAPPRAREEFDGPALPLDWLMARNPRSAWYRFDHGSLVLDARAVGLGDMGNPSFLARRQQHLDATAETLVHFRPERDGDEAGLAAFQNDEHWYAIAVGMAGRQPAVQLKRRTGPGDPAAGVTIASAPLPAPSGEPVRLRVEAEGGRYRFAYAAADGDWHTLGGDQDGTILSTHVAGGFVGTVIGPYARAGAEPDAASPIRLNQLGFLPDGPKRALLPSDSTAPIAWHLVDRGGAVRAHGETVVFGDDPASGEHLHLIDFSTYREAGEALQLVAGTAQSRPFAIRADLIAGLPHDALNYFYQSRAGIPIEARYAGGDRWARPAGHAPDRATCVSGPDQSGNRWEPCAYTLDVSRGWYDAGDQGKYVVNGGIALWTLLDLYELGRARGRAFFPDGSASLPEAGNGVSDLLDEARWELDFMLAMQVPEGTHMRLPVGPWRPGAVPPFQEVEVSGMAHHKVADQRWTPLPTPPQRDRETRYLAPPSTGATLNLAAVAAQCARIWRTIDRPFADRCLAAARRAYAAAKRNPQLIYLGNFTGSGGYGDGDLSDEFYWAAAELYATTGEAAYAADLHASSHFTAAVTEPAWPRTATLGTITLALVPNRLAPAEIAGLRARIVATADAFLGEETQEGYRIPYAAACTRPPGMPASMPLLPPPPSGHCYPWGSNSTLLNRAMLLALASDFTGEARYRAGVIDVMDYLLGRNPLDRSFISGWGARPMQNPHHRFWAHSLDPNLPPPPPGVLSGGPNSTSLRSDPVGPALQGHCVPMTCWRDDIRAFSMNEVAINWNAPLVWVSAWLAGPPSTGRARAHNVSANP